MKNKILTIGIAAYNMENYLSRCLDSVLKISNVEDIEVLVVNDGSKDTTLIIAQKYEKDYPDIVRVIDKDNGGWGSVVNKAIELASGKYFKLLDADDWYETNEFNKLISYLKTTSCDLILTPYVLEFLHKRKKKEVPFVNIEYDRVYENNFLSELNWGKDWFDLPSITYRTEILQKNKISVSECFYADIEYDYLPMQYIENFVFKNLSIYRYYIGREGQSVSKEGITKHYLDHLRITKQAISFYKSIQGVDKYKKGFVDIMRKIAIAKVKQNYTALMYYYTDRRKAKQLLNEFDSYLKNESPALYDAVVTSQNFSKSIYPIKIWRKTRYNIYQSFVYKIKKSLFV